MVGSYQRSGNAARKKSLAGARSAVKKQIPEIIIKSLDKAPALRERCLCTVMGSRTGVILLRSVDLGGGRLNTNKQDALHDGLVLVDQVGSVLLEAVARNVVICACVTSVLTVGAVVGRIKIVFWITAFAEKTPFLLYELRCKPPVIYVRAPPAACAPESLL